MKVAFFSDAHANLPALKAFFKDVESVNPDAIYCLGDLVDSTSLNKSDPDSLKVDFRRVVYDVEKAAKSVEESKFSNDYTKALREAQ